MSGKHRRVYRDTIQGITHTAIKKLALRAGISRLSNSVDDEIRFAIIKMVSELMDSAVKSAIFAKRATIMKKDVKFALEQLKIRYGGVSTFNCHTYGSKLPGGKVKRSRPGTKAMREIKYYQKHSDCLIIPRLPFQKVIKERLQELEGGFRVSRDAYLTLQLVVENHIVDIFKAAHKIALNRKSITVQTRDVRLAYDLMN